MSANWELRLYREGDEAGINDLFRRVFGQDRSLEEWRWKFKEGPLGLTLAQLACDGDHIVGQIAALATRFLCNGHEVLAIQMLDNMIDPDYRKGLHSARMQRALFREGEITARKIGTALLYGFPNRQAYRLGRKLFGYQEVGQIEVRARSLTWSRHVRRLMGNGITAKVVGKVHARIHRLAIRSLSSRLPGTQVRRVHGFDERFDRLWVEASQAFGMIGVRDSRHLDWRYGKRPGVDYTTLALEKGDELLGYIVLACREANVRAGLIADLLTLPDESIAESLLATSLEHFLAQGLDMVECWSTPGGRYEEALQSYFPRRLPDPVLLAFGSWDKTIDEQIASDISRWHVTMGDSDGV